MDPLLFAIVAYVPAHPAAAAVIQDGMGRHEKHREVGRVLPHPYFLTRRANTPTSNHNRPSKTNLPPSLHASLAHS